MTETTETSSGSIKYNCRYCTLTFGYKTQYNDHIMCCEYLSTVFRQRKNNLFDYTLEREKKPDELFALIQHLFSRQVKMEKELNSLRNYVRKDKKKMNVLEYLNKEVRPNIEFDEWRKTIRVEGKHIEKVFEFGNTVCDGIIDSIRDILTMNGVIDENGNANETSGETMFILPVMCFVIRPGEFYLYRNSKWEKDTNGLMEQFYENISNRFIPAYTGWLASPNYARWISNPEHTNHDVANLMMRILGGTASDKPKLKKFKNWLYHLLKRELTTVYWDGQV
jgi:uncharacterized protein YeeX (DUF496 family)